MYVVGISAFYHDSAAALLHDGVLIAAAQEERFTRKKFDATFPGNALDYCLHQAGITLDKVDYVVFYEKPFVKFERLLETYLAFAPDGFTSFRKAIPLWVKEKLFQRRLISNELKKRSRKFDLKNRLLFAEHHQSHAASAFFPSPFDEAVILTMDGVGEWSTMSTGIGRGNGINIESDLQFPHSLGLLYSAFTYHTGFKVNSDEYKMMGLAPYGTPRYVSTILDTLIDLKEDGTFRLDQSYFNYCTGLTMTSKKFNKLFRNDPRTSDEPIQQIHMDMAASIQSVTEEIVLRLTHSLSKRTSIENLCMSGGVALNCVANGKVLRDGCFKNIWIQPAAGDAGSAVGAAYAAFYLQTQQSRDVSSQDDYMSGSYLGPEFSQTEIETSLSKLGANFVVLPDEQLVEVTVDALTQWKAIGWFQGRMEFGPRALGNRSIIADPRSPTMQMILNQKVKERESFRPFAPSVLREDVSEWFDMDCDSPYMLLVAQVANKHLVNLTSDDAALTGINRVDAVRSIIPAVTHVDFSARIHTVKHDVNPRFHNLISSFKERTGCSVLINTSFNGRDEPIVCSPEDAYGCFMGTGLDYLVIGNCFLKKQDQTR